VASIRELQEKNYGLVLWACAHRRFASDSVFYSESRGNREISLVDLGMNEIGVRRSNSYGLVDLTYCSEYTKKII